MEQATVDAVLSDWRSAPIDEPLRAALGLLQAVNEAPAVVPTEALEACRAAGLDVRAIEDVACVGFHFEFITRIADAFDFPMPDEHQQARLAKFLDRAVNPYGRRRPESQWETDNHGSIRPIEVLKGRDRLLSATGSTEPTLRQAAEAHAVTARGGTRSGPAVPEPLNAYLDTLARHAYRITDDHFEQMRAAGYDDDQLLEVTLAGALGAALTGLESIYVGLFSPTAHTGPTATDSSMAASP